MTIGVCLESTSFRRLQRSKKKEVRSFRVSIRLLHKYISMYSYVLRLWEVDACKNPTPNITRFSWNVEINLWIWSSLSLLHPSGFHDFTWQKKRRTSFPYIVKSAGRVDMTLQGSFTQCGKGIQRPSELSIPPHHIVEKPSGRIPFSPLSFPFDITSWFWPKTSF